MVEEETENEWFQPKNGLSMKCVCEAHGKKEDKENNNKKHAKLAEDEEKEEDEEFHKTLSDEKCSDTKVIVDSKNKTAMSNECKAIEWHEDEGDHEKERKEVARASSKLVKEPKGDVEKARAMHEKL